MPSLPGPLRAAVGLAAAAADNARQLPAKAIEFPMVVVTTALQASLRAQQQYAAYAARGEQILTGHGPTEEVAAWATFDEPVDDPAPVSKRVTARRDAAPSRFDAVDEPFDADREVELGDELGDDELFDAAEGPDPADI